MSAASVERFQRKLTAILEVLLAGTLLGMMLVVVVLVVMRYGFESGLVGANETATMAFVYVSSLGAAVAVGKDEHVRVDLLTGHLGDRGRVRLQALTALLVGLLNLALVFTSIVWILKTGHIPMPVTQVPRAVVQASIPIGCGLASIYSGARLASLWRGVWGS